MNLSPDRILKDDDDFLKTPVSNFVIIRPLGVELFHAEDEHTDGRTDRDDEANRGFSQFLIKLLKWPYYPILWIRRLIFTFRYFVFEKNKIESLVVEWRLTLNCVYVTSGVI